MVALSEPVSLTHAFDPTNDSERLVFRELFETLIYIDCRRQVRPGLAQTWTLDGTHRTWTFQLRDDGPEAGVSSPAADVVASWRARPEALTASGIESVAAAEEGGLAITFQSPQDSVPRILADPMLGVAHGRGSTLGRADRFFIARPGSAMAPTEFRVEPASDPRDALDRGADLLVTRDLALLEYVSSRTEFQGFELPWSRTYILAGAGGLSGQLLSDLTTASVRTSLAKDAVRASARVAEPPYWWTGLEKCVTPAAREPNRASSRVIYRKDDEVARGLAERVVALASATTGLRAVGLDAAPFDAAVRGGTERAYVIGLPRQSLAPCRDAAMLPRGASPLPLIETRAYAIVRKGVPPLTVEWDGTVRLGGQ
jgi:hypothetical protein